MVLARYRLAVGRGWGDPLEREPHLVALDVTQAKVRISSAVQDYGATNCAPGAASFGSSIAAQAIAG